MLKSFFGTRLGYRRSRVGSTLGDVSDEAFHLLENQFLVGGTFAIDLANGLGQIFDITARGGTGVFLSGLGADLPQFTSQGIDLFFQGCVGEHQILQLALESVDIFLQGTGLEGTPLGMERGCGDRANQPKREGKANQELHVAKLNRVLGQDKPKPVAGRFLCCRRLAKRSQSAPCRRFSNG